METEQGRLSLLGVVAVTAIVCLAILFKISMNSNVAFNTQYQVSQTPETACRREIQCQNGIGAVPVGTQDNYAVCICPEHVQAWSDEDAPLQYNEDYVHMVALRRVY